MMRDGVRTLMPSDLPRQAPVIQQITLPRPGEAANSECASGLHLRHPAPNGDDLLPEVYRVRFHLRMMDAPSSIFIATR
jgi:hypothetical protein